MQPCRISVKFSGSAPANCGDTATTGNVLDFSYGFNLGTANNGNVANIANNRATTRSQTFTYDELNRVLTAQTTSNLWGNSYVYDIWGNLLQKNQIAGKVDGEFLQQTVGTNNRIAGLNYDAAGNQLNDGVGLTFTYDAENRIVSVGGVSYVYDGDGKRLKKSSGKLYWYGAGSDPLTETDLSGTPTADFIFFGGKRMARLDLPSATVHYYFSDHLGSASVVTNAAGTTIEEESDYYPWGRERVIVDLLPNQNYKFTGKERDTESNLDFFGARYYSSTQGRFMIPDWAASPTAVPYAEFGNPQSLNLYTYAGNNPITRFDADGHCSSIGECVTNVGNALKRTGDAVVNAFEKSGTAVVNAVKDTATELGAGAGLVVGGLATGDGAMLEQGINKIGPTVVLFLATDGAGGLGRAGQAGGARITSTIEKNAARGAAEVSPTITSGVVPLSRGAGPPTSAERAAVNAIGNRTGCATCGAPTPGTQSGNWVLNHVPAKRMAKPGEAFVGIPQCSACMWREGGQIHQTLAAQALTDPKPH